MKRIERHRLDLPAVPHQTQKLLARLQADSVVVSTIDALAVPGTARARAGLDALVERLAARPATEQNPVRPTHQELVDDPAVWRWGLDEGLIDLAEHHLGVPVRYYGADVRRELADGRQLDVRCWHRDTEDHKVLKILVWLNDVSDTGGPFAFLPPEATRRASHDLHYLSGYVSDARMTDAVPPSEWRTCPGPKWTALLTDTSAVFHRAQPPVGADRYSVTFTWTSRRPLRTFPVEPFDAAQCRVLTEGLTERQRACLPLHVSRG